MKDYTRIVLLSYHQYLPFASYTCFQLNTVWFKPQFDMEEQDRDDRLTDKLIEEFLRPIILDMRNGRRGSKKKEPVYLSGLIYCNTKRGCRYVCDLLQTNVQQYEDKDIYSLSIDWYHGEDDDLSKDEQKQKMENWEKNKINIMVTTSALSLGVDKGNVAFVIHWDTPRDLVQVHSNT